MMREEVCIVLNEREPAKARAAELLELRFRASNITASRLAVGEQTAAALRERAPRFVVIDYLLGDVSTGLDVLAALSTAPPAERPRFIFLTDEPSVSVAVQALKLGAEDYIAIDNHRAADAVTALIERALIDSRRQPARPKPKYLRLGDLVFNANAGLDALRSVRTALARRAAAIVLLGERGCGLTTLGRAAALEHGDGLAWSYVFIPSFFGSPADIPGTVTAFGKDCAPPAGHTLVLDRCEADDGEILEALGRGVAAREDRQGTVIALTSDPAAARAYARQLGGDLISIPPLRERRDDIPALIQRFCREAEELGAKKGALFDPTVIGALAAWEWPGSIRQLRTVVINALLESADGAGTILECADRNYARTGADLAAAAAPAELDPLAAAAILEANRFHYRRAAARLGCTVADLHAALPQSVSKREVQP